MKTFNKLISFAIISMTSLTYTALIDARTAWERYRGAQRYVASAEEAARQIARKYDLGAATVTDYNAAVSAQVKARSQLLQAKYEYLFKIKTLTYYTNCCHGE